MDSPPQELTGLSNLTTKIELLINKWANPVSMYQQHQFETLSYREGYNVLSTIAEFEKQEQNPENLDLVYLEDPLHSNPYPTDLGKREKLKSIINVEKNLP